jgi:hypothetical protein
VYLVFNTIMNLTTQAAQVACFRNVAAHLEPGGCFVIEVMIPDLRRLPAGQNVVPLRASPTRWAFDAYDNRNPDDDYELRRGHRRLRRVHLDPFPVRVAGRARPDGSARRAATARAVGRVETRTLHQREPAACLDLGEAHQLYQAIVFNTDELHQLTSNVRSGHLIDVRDSAKMSPVGWEALGQWGEDVTRIEPLAGGVANDVWSVRVRGHLAVGRLGARSDADLAWETELLQHLDREGLAVPVPIPTTEGRLFADGLVVMTYVEGGPPETEADWRRVADTLRRLHRLTQGWPQRPGWRSSTDLLHAETGTKIDLGAMPPEGVARRRAAWARLRALLDAEQRGRGGSLDVRHASSTATPTTLATSA